MKVLCPIIYAIMLALVLLSAHCMAAEGAGVVTTGEKETDAARQLRIYEEALMSGSTEQGRTDAAVELLRRSDDAAWKLLLKALVSRDNPQAGHAVCRGLIASKSWSENVRSRKEFLEPLIGMLIDEAGANARLAADALLVFKYSEVAERLGNLAKNTKMDRQIRLNVVYALKLWPDKEAILELVNLLDDADPEVAAAVANALYWIPLGTNKQTILLQLQHQSPDEIMKARLEGLHQQMSKLKSERNMWEKMYLDGLDRDYEKSDEDAKGKMLVEKMPDDLTSVRLWAIRKVPGFTGTRPKEFRDKLLALISDKDREIRLATAGALVNMSVLNPAEKLLAQLKTETYSDVSLALFDALGEACFFAFSPGSPVTLDESIRTETLSMASKYIVSKDPKAVAKGAEVTGKLLELNGSPKENAKKHLEALAARYGAAEGMSGSLRGKLLNVMARLCGRGAYQQDAAVLYGKFFKLGLAVKDDNSVRQASAVGLVNIDKAKAFRLFKENNLANDSSPVIRHLVIKLAGELGGTEELLWLSGQLEKNGDADPAWQAMRKILVREDTREVLEWGRRLAAGSDKFGYAGELLVMAEKKAEGQKKADLLMASRTSLRDWYWRRGDYAKVIVYCDKLLVDATKPGEREKLQLMLLEAYLQMPDVAKMRQLMASRLARTDMGVEDEFVSKISEFLALEKRNAAAKTAVVKALAAIKPPEARPLWLSQLNVWRQMTTPPETPAGSSPEVTPPD